MIATVGCVFAQELTPELARQIAKEAYVYGFPLVDNYRIQHAYFVQAGTKEFKAPWNQLVSNARVYTPEDKVIQTPNSDTPYSSVGMDLRAEPIVLTVPEIEKGRYYSIQLVDQYTHNFRYIGTRATGNGGGRFLIAGPDWDGPKPSGITELIKCETQFCWAVYRTQLFSPDDLKNVERIQAGYRVEPLSKYLNQASSPRAEEIAYPRPLTSQEQKTSLAFFAILNFVLQYCPVHPSEMDLMERFAKIGIGKGRSFVPEKLQPEIQQAMLQGMSDAWTTFQEFKTTKFDTVQVTSGDVFGTREYLKNNYLYRMAGAVVGIYGNSREEAVYPSYFVDANGEKLNGATRNYRMRIAPDAMPPVDAFWSLTLYELPSSLLSANPIDRYLINSPMLPNLKRDTDGGVTLYIQHESPGKELETNWLPAPSGPFWTVLRLYQPKPEAYDGRWQRPALEIAK